MSASSMSTNAAVSLTLCVAMGTAAVVGVADVVSDADIELAQIQLQQQLAECGAQKQSETTESEYE